MTRFAGGLTVLPGLTVAPSTLLAGEFDVVTLDAKLIGGQQYKAPYARLADGEAAPGAKVNISSPKNHFELDKEFKSGIAAGITDWSVGVALRA